MKKSLQIVRALPIAILVISLAVFSGLVPSSAIKKTSISPSTVTTSTGRDMNATGAETDYPVLNETETIPSTGDTKNSTYAKNSTFPDAFDGPPYFDVTPAEVHIIAVDQTFKVTIALDDVTEENVPAGIGGIEVYMTWNTSWVEPVNFTDYLGVPGTGALIGPKLYALQGFYDSNGISCNQQLAQATEFKVAEASTEGPWWSVNSTGIVAVIAFKVTSPPSSPSTICSLELSYIELTDTNADEVPVSGMIPVSSDCDLSVGYDDTYPDGKSESFYANITAYPTHGDSFVLSYRLLFNGTTSDWINETMTKNGTVYSATIYCWPLPYFTVVQWKVTGYDNGYSFQTPNNEFNGYINWPD